MGPATTLRVKHGARWRTTVTGDGQILQQDEGEVGVDEVFSADFYSLIYNRDISGGISWWNPSTGESIGNLKYKLDVPVDPADLLTGDDLCDCASCLSEGATRPTTHCRKMMKP